MAKPSVVSMVNVGAVTFGNGPGVGVGGLGVGVGVGGGGVGVGGNGVGEGVAGPGVGVIPFVVMVMSPLFCGGEIEFKSISMNSKSFGNALHAKRLLSPKFVITRFQ